MTPVEAAYAAMTLLLVAAAATLVYPALRGFQVVVYRRAVLALGTSVVLFVLGWLGTDLQYFGVIDSDGAYVVSFTVLTVAAALHFAAIWLFVQDFLQFDAGDVSIRADDVEGGFADDAE